MKKLNTIILFGILQFNVCAQTYFPLVDSNAVWTIFHYSQFGNSTKKNGAFGDTLINGFTYKKVFENFDYNFNLTNSSYKGAIRESNKKIYIMYYGHTAESLLYDFTLNVGDTAKLTYYNGFQYAQKVSMIDYISIYGQNHKRWKFNAAGLHSEEYWIEGIGSTFGLLLPLWTGSDNCFTLLCASQNNNLFYEYTVSSNPDCYYPIAYDCDGTLNTASVSQINLNNNKTILFPNPFSNSAILKTSVALNDATLKIYDVLGQEVFIQPNINAEEIKINRGNLAAGNYYYKLTQKSVLISTGKLIIE
ncbi:MAG: T9SS type A sorting domain-containing protein [Bacteroidota bacterium]